MSIHDIQLTDAAGDFKTGRFLAWVLLSLAAAVSLLFTLYVNANNDKLRMVLDAGNAELQYIEKDNENKTLVIRLLTDRLDSCWAAHTDAAER
ncbi:hypothetical protein A9P82_05720 [Arachidicoccus ginsenosidimutans]|uniref:hypothetical protein n=1 Tax=Arachidicoccus sp. BS20 TaxID=1850526 RepID=UPI0007F0C659|nr:hypothetical protein [Arachidicoccus sp. BS20]ANI88829.1 hypothetical protein A9P82_05720 [Arachidicoccus sp. BS20]